jgi:hypothetical protein
MPYWHVKLLEQVKKDHLIKNQKQEKSAHSKYENNKDNEKITKIIKTLEYPNRGVNAFVQYFSALN